MKKIILSIFIATGLLTGCDTREEFFAENSLPPHLEIMRSGTGYTSLSDSVKVTNPEQMYYPIELNLSSFNSQINSLSFLITKGQGNIEYRTVKVVGDRLPSEYPSLTVKYIPSSLGSHNISFTATNRFGIKTTINTSVLFFLNIPPKSNLTVTPVENGYTNEYVLDGSKSFSADAKFGGYIQKYIFKVNNEEFEMKTPKMNYIFPAKGDYQVSLKVVDGDGVANEAKQTLKIN